MKEPVRVYIADEHPLFRLGIRTILEPHAEFEVTGDSADARTALRDTLTFSPDVLLVDAHLPRGEQAPGANGHTTIPGGLVLTQAVKRHRPRTAIVIFTAQEDEEQLFQAMKVGAAAYCLRSLGSAALRAVIKQVHAGDYLLTMHALARPLVPPKVLRQFRDLTSSNVVFEPAFVPLSAREVQILHHIARGYSNKEIARALGISDQTVKNHITSILRKLQVNDRTQAVVYALRHGWIKMQEV